MDITEDEKIENYRVTAGELRQFVERFERLDEEKKAIAEQQKEVMAEARRLVPKIRASMPPACLCGRADRT